MDCSHINEQERIAGEDVERLERGIVQPPPVMCYTTTVPAGALPAIYKKGV
jgi:hypothetical protein